MKTVLIVTYYWPPAGGPGVQRVLKFAKYLPAFGWRPVILTVKRGEYFALDPSLEQEAQGITVYRSGILEPGNLYRKITGMRTEDPIPVGVLEKPPTSLGQKISHAIRRNLFIPDAKIGWYPFGVHLGEIIIRREKPDLIFSSSPPPTVHLIARTLAKKFRLPFVADFRDPWTDIYYYAINPRCPITEKLDKRLETKVMRDASKLVFVTRKHLEQTCKDVLKKCVHIPNGFDEADFKDIPITHSGDKFVLTHMGSLNYNRAPVEIFTAVSELITEKAIEPSRFKLQFIGTFDNYILQLIENYKLQNVVEFTGYLEHREALKTAARASALLLVNFKSPVSQNIIVGKTFEYLRLNKPVIALTQPESELSHLLKKFPHTYVINFNNVQETKKAICTEYNKWLKGDTPLLQNTALVYSFERKHLTQKLADVFNELVNKNS